MKTVIPLTVNQITRQEILDNIEANDGCCQFEIAYDWEYSSIENLNDYLDDAVEDGHLLMDIEYTPVRIKDGEIVFEVCVADVSEYLDEEDEEDY